MWNIYQITLNNFINITMNIEKIRQDLPHYGNKIFLNSAGSSLSPHVVTQKIQAFLHQEELFGGYKLEDIQALQIAAFYKETAKLLNCKDRNIAFAHDATDAYIKALSAIPFKKGDVVITSSNDYASNQIQFISLQNRYGVVLKRINSLSNGDIDMIHFQELLQKETPVLVAITHIPTNSGLIQDVAAIGEICQQQGILYLVDACQSVGQIVVDVQKIKCDFLSATGRKFLRGPRGTGLLYVSDRVLQSKMAPLMIDGWGAKWTSLNEFEMKPSAKRFETWERSYALIIGLTEAIRYANEIGMDVIEDCNKELQSRLRSNLSKVKGVSVYDKGSQMGNLVTFRKADIALEDLKDHLDEQEVYYSVSTLEWGLIDFKEKGVEWVIRFSPHYFNTLEEMDKVAEILAAV